MRLHRWLCTCISAVDVAEQTATRFTDAPLDLRMDLVPALSMHVSMHGLICFCRPGRKRDSGKPASALRPRRRRGGCPGGCPDRCPDSRPDLALQ